MTPKQKDYHNYLSHSNLKNGEQNKYTNKEGELLTTSFF